MEKRRYEVTFVVETEHEYGRPTRAALVAPNKCVNDDGKVCGCYAHSFYCDVLCDRLNEIFGVRHALANAEVRREGDE